MPIKQLKVSATSKGDDNALGYQWLPLLPCARVSFCDNIIDDHVTLHRRDAPCPTSLTRDQLVLQHALIGMGMPAL